MKMAKAGKSILQNDINQYKEITSRGKDKDEPKSAGSLFVTMMMMMSLHTSSAQQQVLNSLLAHVH